MILLLLLFLVNVISGDLYTTPTNTGFVVHMRNNTAMAYLLSVHHYDNTLQSMTGITVPYEWTNLTVDNALFVCLTINKGHPFCVNTYDFNCVLKTDMAAATCNLNQSITATESIAIIAVSFALYVIWRMFAQTIKGIFLCCRCCREQAEATFWDHIRALMSRGLTFTYDTTGDKPILKVGITKGGENVLTPEEQSLLQSKFDAQREAQLEAEQRYAKPYPDNSTNTQTYNIDTVHDLPPAQFANVDLSGVINENYRH